MTGMALGSIGAAIALEEKTAEADPAGFSVGPAHDASIY